MQFLCLNSSKVTQNYCIWHPEMLKGRLNLSAMDDKGSIECQGGLRVSIWNANNLIESEWDLKGTWQNISVWQFWMRPGLIELKVCVFCCWLVLAICLITSLCSLSFRVCSSPLRDRLLQPFSGDGTAWHLLPLSFFFPSAHPSPCHERPFQ